MTNKIFQEVSEKQGEAIEAIIRKYKNTMSLEEIEKDLQHSFNVIVSNICSRIELERQREMDGIKEMKEAMKAIKKACKKFDFCIDCPFEKYCLDRAEGFPFPETWEIEEDD